MTPQHSNEVQQGYTRCYRAVSKAEYQDIRVTGRLRTGINTLEGKWFADTLAGANAYGHALYSDGDY